MGKVSLILASDSAYVYDREGLDRARSEFRFFRRMRFVSLNRPRFLSRIRHELDPSYLNTDRFRARESDRQDIFKIMRGHDVVWIHTIQVANAFRIDRWPRSVLDVDDIPSRLYASAAKANSNIVRTLLDLRMSLIWRRRERLLKNRFSVITVCSENDRQYIGNNSRFHIIPNGFSKPSEVPKRVPAEPRRLGFIGTLHWMPNRNGLEWFIRDVWPRIKLEAPDTCLRLVGSGSDEHFSRMGIDIVGLGYVKDPTEEIASWSAMIVPVKIGGGTRVKIAEAFSRKCPVVSTTLGAFGYKVRSGREILLADRSRDFAQACVRLIKDEALAGILSENAWQRFLSEWTWDSIGKSVERAVQICLDSSTISALRRD